MSDNDHRPLPGAGTTAPDQPLTLLATRSEHLETRDINAGTLAAEGDGKIVILNNFIIKCPPDHGLDTLSLDVIGLNRGEDPTKLAMENVSETKWECSSPVHLDWDTNHLKLVAHSDRDEALGFVVLEKDDILSLVSKDQDTQLEFDLKESNLHLKISFALAVHKPIPEAQSPSQTNTILQSILNSEQDLVHFTSMIKQLPNDPGLLNYLGDVFNDQFEETHHEDDIHKAILAYESAVALSTSENSNHRFYLCDTGLAFTRHYQLSGNLDDLDQAIPIFEASIACNPEGPEDLIESFNNLAMALQYRFNRTGNLPDLHYSISLLQSAVKETSEENPILPLVLNTLGTSFQMLFERSGELDDISAAISAKQKAVDLTPDDSDGKPAFFRMYGTPDNVCVSDFVISSYTPTVSALVNKIKEVPKKESESSLLLISQPNTPGKASIPATREETHAIHEMMRQAGIQSLLLEDDEATTTRVPEELKAHGWVHFACHGSQDPAEPLNSGVHLHDGCLTLREIMRQHIPNTKHAFLSACETSTGHGDLSDEVVHLAAGMLAAGYQGVVATMWSIKDDYGPKIAGAFYEHLLEGTAGEGGKKRLDGVRAAHALDHAICSIREKIGDSEEALLTWVPYVHFGI
ncbi:unnamed protein product [Cyclocybe aegerita]|uniref:CHAT domain-containing protein n=1 Tax=Cyclocybe aegerita TaxID=1973307 RepID=A0A8S0VTL6_CYCAE|nr:unnamed protein product [Cyclocybe aegerita]